MNILLIDDDNVYNFLNLSLIKLSGLGQRVDICKSAMQGIRFLESCEVPPDLIFLDIKMPDMDGHGFLSEFSRLPERITSETKITMLTSSLDPEDRQRAMAHENVIYFIEKPLTEDKIKDLVGVLNRQI